METKTKSVKTSNKKETAKSLTPKKAEQEKPQKSTTQIDEVLNPTAEQRIRKIKNFQLLAEKHEFLKNKFDELENFIVSSDGTKEKITLSNAKGFHFEVANTQVIEEIVEVLKERLKTFTKASEQEILEYSI